MTDEPDIGTDHPNPIELDVSEATAIGVSPGREETAGQNPLPPPKPRPVPDEEED